MLYQPGTVTFTDPLSRTQALEKWDRWAASSDGQEGAKAKPEPPASPAEGQAEVKPVPAGTPRPAPLEQ